MKLRHKVALVLTTSTALAGLVLGVGGTAPAHAASGTVRTMPAVAASHPRPEFNMNQLSQARRVGSSGVCGNRGTGYCLNNWGGHTVAGNPVKMYNGGASNENFFLVELSGTCNGAGSITVSSSCWSQWGSNGNLLIGDNIVAVAYGPGGCVGSDANGLAILANCPDNNGNNGGTGTVYAESFGGPLGDFWAVLYSRVWSQLTSPAFACLQSGGNVGVQASASHKETNGDCTQWDGPSIG